jgi:hypothetical protein
LPPKKFVYDTIGELQAALADDGSKEEERMSAIRKTLAGLLSNNREGEEVDEAYLASVTEFYDLNAIIRAYIAYGEEILELKNWPSPPMPQAAPTGQGPTGLR